MSLEVIPASLYAAKQLVPMLSDERSSILHKTLSESLLETGKYIATPLIVYILRGRQVIRDAVGLDTVIGEGQLVLLPKGIYFVSDFVPDDGAFEALLFFIDGTVIDRFLRSCSQAPGGASAPRPLHCLQASERVRRYAAAIDAVYAHGENSAALLELKLLELLHLIAMQEGTLECIRALADDSLTDKRPITEFMAQYYSRHLRIEHYASLTGRSVSTFTRDFKTAYNTTPNQWLIDRRIEGAHRLLTEQNATVTSAALEAGYENVSHFISAYKRRYGVTPKQAKGDALRI